MKHLFATILRNRVLIRKSHDILHMYST